MVQATSVCKQSRDASSKQFFRTDLNRALLNSDAMKRLIFDLHTTWSSAQELATLNNEQLRPDTALALSQRYRKCIRTALKDVKRISEESMSVSLYHELYNADVLWTLVEAVYVQTQDTSIVLDLANWGMQCFGESARSAVDRVLEHVEACETHELYWNAVVLSVIALDFTSAVRLIRKHSRLEKDAGLKLICYYIEHLNSLLTPPFNDAHVFIDAQRQIRDAIRANTFKRSENVELIAALLIGKPEAFEKCARSLLDRWYELLPAYILFTSPGATMDTLADVAKSLYQLLCPTSHVSVVEQMNTELDRSIFSILRKSFAPMLLDLCERSSTWWLPVHLIDLMGAKLDPYVLSAMTEQMRTSDGTLFDENGVNTATSASPTAASGGATDENRRPLAAGAAAATTRVLDDRMLRTSMVLDYGGALLESPVYWNIAAAYILACGSESPTEDLDAALAHVELSCVRKSEQIYALAVKYELPATRARVAQALVDRYIGLTHYNEALSWALRSKSPALINRVSNKMLSSFDAHAISELRIFDGISEIFFHLPNLLLLQRFYQFRRSLLAGNATDAVARLYELVTCGMAPIAFQIVLFDQMTKLLDPSSSDSIQVPELDRDSVYDIMKAVNSFQIQHVIVHPKEEETPQAAELRMKIKRLRETLCPALEQRSLN